MRALQAEAEEKTNQGIILSHAGIATRLSAEAELKAIEAEESGKRELAELYRGAAVKQEEAATLFMQALQQYTEEETHKGIVSYNAGCATQSSAEAELKAIEADKSGKTALGIRYREIAAQQKEVLALLMQALQKYTEGKTNQGTNLNNISLALARKYAEISTVKELVVIFQQSGTGRVAGTR